MIIEGLKLSPLIEFILNQELKRGNKIAESNKGWPEKESLLIILEEPFRKRYRIADLRYLNLNDPRYWKEEYEDQKLQQTIACRF